MKKLKIMNKEKKCKNCPRVRWEHEFCKGCWISFNQGIEFEKRQNGDIR